MYTNYVLEIYRVDLIILKIPLSFLILTNIRFFFCSKFWTQVVIEEASAQDISMRYQYNRKCWDLSNYRDKTKQESCKDLFEDEANL